MESPQQYLPSHIFFPNEKIPLYPTQSQFEALPSWHRSYVVECLVKENNEKSFRHLLDCLIPRFTLKENTIDSVRLDLVFARFVEFCEKENNMDFLEEGLVKAFLPQKNNHVSFQITIVSFFNAIVKNHIKAPPSKSLPFLLERSSVFKQPIAEFPAIVLNSALVACEGGPNLAKLLNGLPENSIKELVNPLCHYLTNKNVMPPSVLQENENLLAILSQQERCLSAPIHEDFKTLFRHHRAQILKTSLTTETNPATRKSPPAKKM